MVYQVSGWLHVMAQHCFTRWSLEMDNASAISGHLELQSAAVDTVPGRLSAWFKYDSELISIRRAEKDQTMKSKKDKEK